MKMIGKTNGFPSFLVLRHMEWLMQWHSHDTHWDKHAEFHSYTTSSFIDFPYSLIPAHQIFHSTGFQLGSLVSLRDTRNVLLYFHNRDKNFCTHIANAIVDALVVQMTSPCVLLLYDMPIMLMPICKHSLFTCRAVFYWMGGVRLSMCVMAVVYEEHTTYITTSRLRSHSDIVVNADASVILCPHTSFVSTENKAYF